MAGHVDEKLKTAAKGPRRTIEYARRSDGSMLALDFYRGLSVGDQAKVVASFQRTANHGEIRQQRKFKQVDDEIFAFKWDSCDGRMIRMPCFRINNTWYLTHGFWKPARPKWRKAELDLAFLIREEHIAFEASKARKGIK